MREYDPWREIVVGALSLSAASSYLRVPVGDPYFSRAIPEGFNPDDALRPLRKPGLLRKLANTFRFG